MPRDSVGGVPYGAPVSTQHLEPITPANVEAAMAVRVRPDQERFITPVAASLAEALVLLRARAFATGRPILELARDVLDGRVRLSSTDGAGPG